MNNVEITEEDGFIAVIASTAGAIVLTAVDVIVPGPTLGPILLGAWATALAATIAYYLLFER